MEREPHQGAWVKDQRELLKLTQGKLVEALRAHGFRLSRSHLANIEAGTYAVPAGLVRGIAALRGLDVRETWQHLGTLPRTRNDRGPTLHQLSQVADTGRRPVPGVVATPASPVSPGTATEQLDWARNKMASLASGRADRIVLTTAGPLADALRDAPAPGGFLDGILGHGIRAVLEKGAELHHILAVPDDPEAHFEILTHALPMAARYCPPVAPSRSHLSRYHLTLVPDSPAGLDLIAASHTSPASMIVPVIRDGRTGVAVAEVAPRASEPDAGPSREWARDYAAWLAARGTDLFSWVTVVPTGTLSMPTGPWEEHLTEAWKHACGRDSIQRMLPLNTMSDDLRRELVSAQAERGGSSSGSAGEADNEVEYRMNMYRNRRGAMIRNLQNGYSHRNVVTREALDDLIKRGQYTMERVPDNVLTAEQTASYLRDTIDLIRNHEKFEVLLLTDEQLEQGLPLGVSWIVRRSPPNQDINMERAWAFLPYVLEGKPMAMNVIVNDKYAVEAIGSRIDALWATWTQGRTADDIRQEALTELESAQRRI